MPTDPITSINHVARLTGPGGIDQTGKPKSALDNFSQILGDALSRLSETEGAANNAVASLAAGEDIELHQVMLAMQEADIAFQLALQVRNKLVEAYQEVMRMQV